MNIALSFPGCHRRGGVERVVFECARYLAGRGHEVNVFADDWESDSLVKYQAVPASRLPRFLHNVSYFKRCAKAIEREDYDILNTHGCVCPTGGVQWVQSVHVAWLDRCREFRPLFSSARFKQYINLLHPMLLRLEVEHFRKRKYRKLIATTPEVRRDLHRFYDVPEEDVVVIPNGFSPKEFSPIRRAERRGTERKRIGLQEGDVALLFAANELERKGYATILGALRRLGQPRLKLLVVGRARIDQIKREAARFGVLEQVIACGSTSDIAAYHAAADLFVLPTQYEAFSLAILEALGSGLPVITTKVPGASDAIQPGVNGLLIDNPKDDVALAAAITTLLDDDLRAAYSAKVPGTAEPYQWPVILGRYEDVLMRHCR